MNANDALRMLNELMEDDVVDTLNSWESDFIYDLSIRAEKGFNLTENQANKLKEIFNDKVISTIKVRGRFDCERR